MTAQPKAPAASADVEAIMLLADEYCDFLEGFDPEEQFKQATDSRSARRAALESAIRQRIAELEKDAAQPVSADVEEMCERLDDLCDRLPKGDDLSTCVEVLAMLRSLDAQVRANIAPAAVSAGVAAMCVELGDIAIHFKNEGCAASEKECHKAIALLRSRDARVAELEGLLRAEFGAPWIAAQSEGKINAAPEVPAPPDTPPPSRQTP